MNISFNGAGKNITEANKLSILNIDDLKIGFLSFSSIRKYQKFVDDEYGISEINLDIVKKSKNDVDFLIVYMHWGNEYDFKPSEYQIINGRRIIDSGADIIIGAHPHVIQPYEKYNGKYIFYSLGNFVFDQEHEATKNSIAVRVFFDDKNISKIQIINLRIHNTKPFIINIEDIT